MHAHTHRHTHTHLHAYTQRKLRWSIWCEWICCIVWLVQNANVHAEICACMHTSPPPTHRHSTEASDVNGSIWCQSPVQDSIVLIIYIPTVWFPRLITACSMKLQVGHNQVRTITPLYISTGFGAYNLLCWCHTWPVKIFTNLHYSISLPCPS